ncbi:MAG: hypothetical protein CVV39_02565 [Planctomycetes bacterium HGW-Planctomycetes-1]|nr:MAG: hypothetical protein CVV39_02565 [Planctomycetes bacterium HGW-Planctomycetes-1]
MGNLLNQEPDYVLSQNKLGVTRRYLYESGMLFREFTSHWKIGVLPLVHITSGIDPKTGQRVWAKGFIAIGRKAVGFIAVGQLAVGLLAIGQMAIGLVLALGQLSVAGLFAVGQMAAGIVAIGQFSAGFYSLGQFATGRFVFSVKTRDYEAVTFFKSLFKWFTTLFR